MIRDSDDLFLTLARERGLLTFEQDRWVRRRLFRAELKARHICVEQGWITRARSLAVREDVIAILARQSPPSSSPQQPSPLHRHWTRSATRDAPSPRSRTSPWIPFALPALLFAFSPLALPEPRLSEAPQPIKTARAAPPRAPLKEPLALPPAPKPRALTRRPARPRPRTLSLPMPTKPVSLLAAAAGLDSDPRAIDPRAIDPLVLGAARAEAEQAWSRALPLLEQLHGQNPHEALRLRLDRARRQSELENRARRRPRSNQTRQRWRAFLQQLPRAPLKERALLAERAAILAAELPAPEKSLAALHRDALQALEAWPRAAAQNARQLTPHASVITLPGQLRGHLQGVDLQGRLLVSLDTGAIAIPPEQLPLNQILELLEDQPLLEALVSLYRQQLARAWTLLENLLDQPLARRLLEGRAHFEQLFKRDEAEPEAEARDPETPPAIADVLENRLPELLRDASFAQALGPRGARPRLTALYDFTPGLKTLSAQDWLSSGTAPRPDALSAALHLDGSGQAAHKLLLARGRLDLHITITAPPAPGAELRLILRAADRKEAWVAPFAQQLLHQRQNKTRTRAGERRQDLLQPGRSLRLTIGRDQGRIYTAIDGQLTAEITTKNSKSPLRVGFAWSNISLDLHAISLEIQPDPDSMAARLKEKPSKTPAGEGHP